MNGDTIRTITIRGQSEGLDKLTADVNKLAAAQQNVAVVSEQSAKRVLSLEDAWKRQTLRLDEAARAQANIARETKIADAALREGLATQAQHAQRLDQINQRYAAIAPTTKVFTEQIGLARHEMINMSRQIQDVGVGLASGQSPFTVMVQQGAQIADIFASSSGTVKGFFGQVASGTAGFLGSFAGATTVVAGLGASIVYVANQYASAQQDIGRALAGIGAASGVTREQLNKMASESATAFGLSTKEAREAATTFVATGEISGSNIAKATAMVKDFARATGTDAAEATKRLAAAMLDPAKGALDLDKSLGALDATTLNYIRSLQAQGREQEAIAVMFDKLRPKVEKQAEYVQGLPLLWDLATNALSNWYGMVGKIAMQGPLPAITPPDSGDGGQTNLNNMSKKADAAALSIMGVRAQITALETELSKLSKFSEAGGEMTAAMTAAMTVGQVLRQQLIDQNAALERQSQWVTQIAAQYPGMSLEVAKQLDAMNQQLAVAQARGGIETLMTQQVADFNAARAKGLSLEEAMLEATKKRELTEANIAKSVDDQIHNLEDQLKLINARIAGTEAATRAEIAYDNAIRQGAKPEDAARLRSATRDVADAQDKATAIKSTTAATNAAAKAESAQHAQWQKNAADAIAGSQAKKAAEDAAKLAAQRAQDQQDEAARAKAEAQREENAAIGIGSDGMHHFGWEVAHVTMQTYQMIDAFKEFNQWFNSHSKEWQIDNRLFGMPTQFDGQTFESTYDPLGTYQQKLGMEAAFGAENVEPTYQAGTITGYKLKQSYYDAQTAKGIEGLNVSSPSAIQASLQQVLPRGDMGPINRLIDIADPSQQTSLIQQTIDYIRQSEPPSLATEEKIRSLTDKMEQLANSTDSLNATMQSALSPFYSQDPRTTKLGFRAGVTGNPDWMTGAGNSNPLVAVLGAGATAPGMADGGSFTVGGGYSANDNRMAVFPVASGEEVVVNRNKDGGRGGQVVHIDNRIIIAGSVNADALSKMKVSRYQQAQRMRGQIAQA